MESISQSVWVVLLLGEVLICLLLMILIRNKMLKLGDLMFFFLLGSGFSLALSSALCRAVQSSL
jgi:3-oxoacyl-[acyl-carrier-protein] synthase III